MASTDAGNWRDQVAKHPAGLVVLVTFAVAEGAIFPAPTESLLLALWLLGHRSRSLLLSLTLGGSFVGSAVGYAIGAANRDAPPWPVLNTHPGNGMLASVRDLYADNLFLALATSGFTPIPYFIYTIGAGLAGVSLSAFLGYSLAGRALKYILVAALALAVNHSVPQRWQRMLAAGLMILSVILLASLLFT